MASEVTDLDVREVVKDLPNDKAPGPDKIPDRLLKHCKALERPLATLFTACL